MISALAVYPVLGLTGWQKEEGEGRLLLGRGGSGGECDKDV